MRLESCVFCAHVHVAGVLVSLSCLASSLATNVTEVHKKELKKKKNKNRKMRKKMKQDWDTFAAMT